MNDKMEHSKGSNSGLRRASVLGWLRLMRISRRISQAEAGQLEQWNLSSAQFDVIAQVGAAEGITQLDLSRHLLVTQGNVTQLLDRLEGRGLIHREREGRARRLYLTPAGRELFANVVPRHEDFIDSRFAVLSRAEQHQLLRLLAKLERGQRSSGSGINS